METEVLSAPADFGDWQAEYRAFVDSCAVTARPDRGTVRVEGDRRAEMLNGLLTNDILKLQGSGRHAKHYHSDHHMPLLSSEVLRTGQKVAARL